MPKRIYQVGEPCDICQTPCIQGQKGAYCKPCYIKWAESKKNISQAPLAPQYDPLQEDLQRRVANMELAIANMRIWAAKVQKEIDGFKTLSVDIHGKDAVDLHTSFKSSLDDIPIV